MIWRVAWILAGLLPWALLTAALGSGVFTPEVTKKIDAAKIGESIGFVMPAGDGCNSCTCSVRKVSETHVIEEGCQCTLVACVRPFQYKEEKKP